ncbi:hypothetical protein HK099_006668 [Clydaea vesicula]|uniref:Tyrosine specific protein phosphatases domain-containing protein n=1 Tax=Clydaea vesicula TaxID=447962 RepID=A0AAD5TXE1_9FUNG|nr:hypothetical protein HK099_006668 [Clydaea vesicula]
MQEVILATGNCQGTLLIKNNDASLEKGNFSKLVIIVHGYLGHKDYLFQKSLAEEMSHSSFRLSVQESSVNTISPETWVDSIDNCVKFFLEKNWRIYCLVGHSIGGSSVLSYLITKNPFICRFAINISGRHNIYDGLYKKLFVDPEQINDLMVKGTSSHNIKVKEQEFKYSITKETVSSWKKADVIFSRSHLLPKTLAVLTCHGTMDEIVPMQDAAEWANKIPNHQLALINNACHNFLNRKNLYHPSPTSVLISTCLAWFHKIENDFDFFWLTYGNFSTTFDQIKIEKSEDDSLMDEINYLLPNCRVLTIPGVKNFRDVGGFPTVDGKIVKRGVLYRSAKIDDASAMGLTKINNLGIRYVIDLRSNLEGGTSESDEEFSNFSKIHLPIFNDDEFTPEVLKHRWGLYATGTPEGFSEAYMLIVKSGIKSFIEVFKYLAGVDESQTKQDIPNPLDPVLFHCTSGKDRTGVLVALILSLLGVDDDLIAMEYNTDEELNKILLQTKNVLTLKEIKSMMTSNKSAMSLFLKKFKLKYYSVEKFLLDFLNLSQVEINNLKDRLTYKPNLIENQTFTAQDTLSCRL